MSKKRIILIAGISLVSIFGWSQIAPVATNQPLNGYRSFGQAAVVYYSVRQSSSSYNSSSGSYSGSSYSSGGSSYGK